MTFRLRRPFPLGCAWVLCLAALPAVPTRSLAQGAVVPVVPIGEPGPHPFGRGHGWGFCAAHLDVPRTYSYQYGLWLNRPRHTRVVGPDGRTYWQTTVRGLPLGTPWPGP
jgi:hypothetical protein